MLLYADPDKIIGLVLPKASKHAGNDDGATNTAQWNPRARMDGAAKKARKEAKRKDGDDFSLVCSKTETLERVLTFVSEMAKSKKGNEHDLRCERMLDVLTISSFRQGFTSATGT